MSGPRRCCKIGVVKPFGTCFGVIATQILSTTRRDKNGPFVDPIMPPCKLPGGRNGVPIFIFVSLSAMVGLALSLPLALTQCGTETKTTDDTVDIITALNVSINVTSIRSIPIDLTFVYDKSTSMLSSDIVAEQAFIELMIEQFNQTLGIGKLRVGVISFGCDPRVEVSYTFDLASAILRVIGSGTDTEPCTRTDRAFAAFETMDSVFFQQEELPEVRKKLLVVLSDGSVFPQSALDDAENRADAIKAANTTIFSVYVNSQPQQESTAQMRSFSSCGNSGAASTAGKCIFFFNGTYDDLEQHAPALALDLASQEGVDKKQTGVTEKQTFVYSESSSSEEDHCVFDRQWLYALLLLLPLLFYLCWWVCTPSSKDSGKAVTMPRKIRNACTPGIPASGFAGKEDSALVARACGEDQDGGGEGPLFPCDAHDKSSHEGRSYPSEAAIESGEEGRLDESGGEMPAACLPPARSKWATVKTDHYLWAGSGGTTRLNVDFGRGANVPSAPLATDEAGNVINVHHLEEDEEGSGDLPSCYFQEPRASEGVFALIGGTAPVSMIRVREAAEQPTGSAPEQGPGCPSADGEERNSHLDTELQIDGQVPSRSSKQATGVRERMWGFSIYFRCRGSKHTPRK